MKLPLNKKIEALMTERGFNYKSLSLAAKLGETAVRDIIVGRVSNPRKDTLEKLAHALGISLNALLADNASEGNMGIDDALMMKAAEAITKAASASKINLSLPIAMVYTVKLYKYIMEYRKKDGDIEPNEAIAALILKQTA